MPAGSMSNILRVQAQKAISDSLDAKEFLENIRPLKEAQREARAQAMAKAKFDEAQAAAAAAAARAAANATAVQAQQLRIANLKKNQAENATAAAKSLTVDEVVVNTKKDYSTIILLSIFGIAAFFLIRGKK